MPGLVLQDGADGGGVPGLDLQDGAEGGIGTPFGNI
uniref:Uncharacterized protein n=1 Tax=Solanum lycopersicum TaxID=4081 RepID=A0A3Q7HVH6_SOLLC